MEGNNRVRHTFKEVIENRRPYKPEVLEIKTETGKTIEDEGENNQDLIENSINGHRNFSGLGQSILEISEAAADKMIENREEHQHDYLELK